VVRVLLALGCVIIVIVSLNFINLTTAQAMVRAREVGIRKTLGSSRRGLIVQFLVEAGITCFVALLVCTLFLWIAIPFLDTLTERQTDFSDFFLSDLWKYLLTFQLFGTLVIGIYPAVKLSSFRPVEVLKGLLVPKAQGSFFREIFVGFQALVSFSLVAGILIIIDQVRFIRSKELGIDINQVLVIRTPQGFENLQEYLTSMNTLKSELMKDSRIASASISADSPGEPVNWIGGARKAGLPAADNISVYRSVIDRDYINTLGISLIAGTNFQTERSERDVMLNQSAVRALGFESEEAAIGQILSFAGDHDFTVTGVVEDFHQVSPREMVLPTTYHCNLEAPRLMFVRFNTSDAATVIEMAQGSFEGLFPSEPFDYYFLDEFFDRQYTLERKLSSILGTFCVLAVVVSSLGLLGLTWFRLSRQKKALAIRKIVGSGELRLFYDASARLMRTTLIGCFAGIPVTWLVMTRWLQTFSLHTEPKSWQFGLALMTSLFIAVLTISNYTLKIIRTNPVLHLRQD
jgi:putative ABC transport system permease protein